MEKLSVSGIDSIDGMALIEFSNGSSGLFDAQFLMDNISQNGNRDVTDSEPKTKATKKKPAS